MERQRYASPIGLRDIDIRLLHVYRVVADCGGLSAAQVALNISASTISIHLSSLEKRLGMRLCERGPGGFALTEQGRQVYAAATKLARSLEDFRAEVGALRGGLVGDLAIGVVDSTISDRNSPLMAALRDFQAGSHGVHLRLRVWEPGEIERAVLDGLVHVGIGKFYHRLPGVAHEPLYEEELGLYCAGGHPLFDRAPDRIEMSELATAGYVSRGYVSEGELPGWRLDVKPAATAYHMEGIAMLVLTGRYIGYLPVHYARRWVEEERMRPILPSRVNYANAFTIITRRNAPSTPVLRAFLASLRRGRSAAVA